MKIKTEWLLLIGLLLLNINLFATGSPYANIKLKPIATNYGGQVLFQTFSDVNREGSYSCTSDKFGWLVVSADGLWDERVAYGNAEIFDKSSCEFRDKEKYEAYKNGKINLKNPDAVLKKMLEEYQFNRTIEESNERFKVLELKPKQSCLGGKCIEQVLPQKSIGGLLSTALVPSKDAKSLRSSFYYEGVALFRTPNYVDEETTLYSKGDNKNGYESLFNLPKQPRGREFYEVYIDTVVFVDPFRFRVPKAKVKKEIEEVVYDVVKLLKNADVQSFETINKKYIHPKYGFYFVQRPGVMDYFYHYKKFNIDNVVNKRRAYTAIDSIIGEKTYKIPKIAWKTTHYSCENDTWSAKGLIVNDMGYNIPEGIYEFEHSPKEEKIRAKFLAKDSWSVTVTEWSVVFELKKIEGRWYIVLVNSSEMDCSA